MRCLDCYWFTHWAWNMSFNLLHKLRTSVTSLKTDDALFSLTYMQPPIVGQHASGLVCWKTICCNNLYAKNMQYEKKQSWLEFLSFKTFVDESWPLSRRTSQPVSESRKCLWIVFLLFYHLALKYKEMRPVQPHLVCWQTYVSDQKLTFADLKSSSRTSDRVGWAWTANFMSCIVPNIISYGVTCYIFLCRKGELEMIYVSIISAAWSTFKMGINA